jgi:hypothetical protein
LQLQIVLSPGGEPGGQARRQVRGDDFFLGYSEIVGHAMEGHDPGVGVEHGEGGAPVAVAGLADGAGIDEIAAIFAERPVGRLGLANGAIAGAVGFADRARKHEAALQVSVSEERDGGGIGNEWFDGVAGADCVFIFVERGAVDELDAGEFVEMDGTLRQRAEPFEIFGGELIARPESSEAGDRVEVVEVHEAADGSVVIAADEDASERLCFGNDFIGIAAVADGVSEIDDEVVGGSGGQTSVQRFEVAVNIAEKKDAHGKGRIIASLGRKRRGRKATGERDEDSAVFPIRIGASLHSLRKRPALPLLLGGAAVYRCGNCLVLNSALAAEGAALDQELLFPQVVQRCRKLFEISRGCGSGDLSRAHPVSLEAKAVVSSRSQTSISG